MTLQLFDKYSLAIPPKLKWQLDGIPGRRVLFIADPKKMFNVSFEEGMRMMDMLEVPDKTVPTVSYQCCKDGKYIHLRRSSSGRIANAFFHIELEDDAGTTMYLPGQIVVTPDYQWSDGIEPVLMQLLESIDVI